MTIDENKLMANLEKYNPDTRLSLVLTWWFKFKNHVKMYVEKQTAPISKEDFWAEGIKEGAVEKEGCLALLIFTKAGNIGFLPYENGVSFGVDGVYSHGLFYSFRDALELIKALTKGKK